MKKYVINSIVFKTQKQIQDYAKSILYDGNINQSLSGKDFAFMVDYFKTFHHEWDEKVGVGLLAIRKEREPMYGKHRAFFIYRVDGSKTDISYTISKIKGRNYLLDFRAGLREVIKPQIKEFRRRAFENTNYIICPITNEKVNFQNSHIDHYKPTFLKIVDDFIKAKKITDFKSHIAPSVDNQYVNEIITDHIVRDFYSYHYQVANLRVLSKKANLKRKKKCQH